jgi:hypothetical protein
MYFSKIYASNYGFTNQVFVLINSIIDAYNKNERVLIVDYFLNEIYKNEYTQISNIFDIEKINHFLFNKYNILLFDKHNAKFELYNVRYGTSEITIDLTNYIKDNYLNNNVLFISKNTVFNDIHSDPVVNQLKNVFIKYKINEYIIEEIFDENLQNDICYDILNSECVLSNSSWINFSNIDMFNDILCNIHYNISFIENSQNICQNLNLQLSNNINIIHLRLENDGITYWSKMNSIDEIQFKNILEQKYINLIEKFIDKNDQTIILTSNPTTNNVIDFLSTNHYNFLLTSKIFNEREKNAIIDFLISKCCNNIFIGNFNFINMNGSSFSYYISKMINNNNNNNNNKFIDLDNIYTDFF